METRRFGLWAPVLVLAAAIVLLALSAGSVDAARGGGKGGKPSGCTPTAAVVVVSPNPVPLGSTSFEFSGTGFCANQYVLLDVPGKCCIQSTTTDGNGAFRSNFPFDARHAGITNTAAVWNSSMTTLLGYTYFTVQ